jgi:hypothetical protein
MHRYPRPIHTAFARALSVAAVLFAVACGESPAPGGGTAVDPLDPNLAYLTDQEAAERVQALKNDGVAIGNGFLDGALNAAIEGVPTSVSVTTGVPNLAVATLPVPHLVIWNDDYTESRLATGTFAYDESTLDWTYDDAPSNELIARWRSAASDGSPMELRVIWDPVVTVTYPDGEAGGLPTSVPSGWRAVLRRNDVAIADVDAGFAFRSCAGVRMAEPTRLAFSGFAGDGAARADVRAVVLEAVGDDGLRLSADVGVRSGSLQLDLEADFAADVALERDAACWPVDFEVAELTGTLRVRGPGPVVQVRGDVTLTPDPDLYGYAIALRDGRFVSGDKRVDLVATVAADEADPASRLFLTFADGVVRDVVDFVNAFGLAD